jgi:hypothetical protein
LPVFGVQADLFGDAMAKMPAEARDEVAVRGRGLHARPQRRLEPIPEGTPPRFHQAVLRGYEKGQQATQEDFLAGQLRKKSERRAGADQAPRPQRRARAHHRRDAGEGAQVGRPRQGKPAGRMNGAAANEAAAA